MTKVKEEEELTTLVWQTSVCRLCLSADRRLTDVQCVLFAFNLVTDWESAEGVRVCWECRARLRNIHVFKLQAAWAKNALELAKTSEVVLPKSVTNLTSTTKTSYDIEYTEDDDFVPIKVKEEIPDELDVISNDDADICVDVWTEPIPDLTPEEPVKEKKRRGRKPKKEKKKHGRKPKKDKKLKEEMKLESVKNDNDDCDLIDAKNDEDLVTDTKSDFDSKHIEAYVVSDEELQVYRSTRLNTHKFKTSTYKCHTCMLRFVNETFYNRHAVLHSEASGAHECDICRIRFHCNSTLSDHRQAHYVLLRCLRPGCNFVHHRTKVMKAHQTIHKSKPPIDIYTTDRFECDYCGRSYKIRKRLCSHMRKHKRQVVCEICGYKAPDASKLRQHNLAHLDPSFRPHQCDTCQKRFTSKHQLSVHVRIHTGERFICESCGARFRDIYKLARHNRMRHNIGDPVVPKKWLQPRTKSFFTNIPDVGKRENARIPKYIVKIGETDEYNCKVCDKVMRLDDVRSHCVMHRKVRETFECKDCNKTFNQSSNYEKHMATQHSDERPHQCNICGATFKIKPNLKIHMSIHSDEKPFKCDQCDSCFKRRATLWTHKLVHKGVKPHECNICGARFLVKGNLNGHMKVHTKETPYECGICGQSFPWNRNLKNHMKVHEVEPRPMHQL